MKNRDAFNSSIHVPFFSPWITKSDKKAIIRALDSPLLTSGPKLERFEKEFAKFTGAKYAVGVSNATSALQLSLKSCGIKKGDEVIIPDLTFVATANAISNNGATPVLADVNTDDYNILVSSIKKKITLKTKAILPVHFAGKVCDIKEIKKIADKNNLILIEDCAHAIGAWYRNKHVGTFGNAGCFSFYPTKNITTIEGGMIITNSKKIAEYTRSLRNHGITRSLTQRYSKGKPWDYDVMEAGYNYRLDEIRASLGISQLKRIRKLNLLRRKAVGYYNSKLQNIEGIIIPKLAEKNTDAHHLYVIRVIERKFKISRDKLYQKLLENGIRATVHYKPLHQLSAYKSPRNKNLKNATSCYKEIISLPLYPQISKFEQDRVVSTITKIRN